MLPWLWCTLSDLHRGRSIYWTHVKSTTCMGGRRTRWRPNSYKSWHLCYLIHKHSSQMPHKGQTPSVSSYCHQQPQQTSSWHHSAVQNVISPASYFYQSDWFWDFSPDLVLYCSQLADWSLGRHRRGVISEDKSKRRRWLLHPGINRSLKWAHYQPSYIRWSCHLVIGIVIPERYASGFYEIFGKSLSTRTRFERGSTTELNRPFLNWKQK